MVTEKTRSGKRAGLVFLLDSSDEIIEETELDDDVLKNTIDLESSRNIYGSARIYINTLESFTDNRGGSYAMTVLKKMTGTKSFLKQTDKDKNCMIQTVEDCQARGFMEMVQKNVAVFHGPSAVFQR